MTNFIAIMHQITLQRSPTPLSGIQGPTSKGREGRGGERDGREETKGRGQSGGRKGYPVFPLSRPVNPKHNPCTCRMMLRCCPAMAREQILTLNHKPEQPECPSVSY